MKRQMNPVLSALIMLSFGLTACGGALPPPDRSGLPTPTAKVDWQPPQVETWTLKNGATVWMLHQDQAPLVSIRLVLPNGAATDPIGKAGLTALTADLLDEGAGTYSALALSETLQRLATDYGVGTSTDGVVLSMDLLASQLSPSLARLADIVRRPQFTPEEFERVKAQRLAGLLAAEADPNTAKTLTMRRVLFGEGYGAWPAGGVRATLGTLTLDDVKAQHTAVFQPEDATFIVVGAVDRSTLDPALDTAFGTWRGRPSAKTLPVTAPPQIHGVHFIDFPGKTQAAISVARRAPGVGAPDEFEAMVMNWSLGGSFTSRINLNLREDKGYTYGARSGFYRYRQAGMYAHGARVKRDTTRASLEELFKELVAIATDRPVTAEEHSAAVGGLVGSFPSRFERMSAVASELAALAMDGEPIEALRMWPKRVGAVTMAQTQAAAKMYTRLSDYEIFIAGDLKILAPTLADLELPILRYDAQGRRITGP